MGLSEAFADAKRRFWPGASAPAVPGAPKPSVGLKDFASAARGVSPSMTGEASSIAAHNVGMRVGGALKAAAPLARGAGLTSLASGFGDYKLNDPGVDSSAMGTVKDFGDMAGSALSGDIKGAFAAKERLGAGLRKGLLETGLDVASGVARTGDAIAGLAGFKPELTRTLRDRVEGDLGTQLQPTTDASLSYAVKPAQPAAPTEPAVGPAVDQSDAETDRLSRQNAAAVEAQAAAANMPGVDVSNGIRRVNPESGATLPNMVDDPTGKRGMIADPSGLRHAAGPTFTNVPGKDPMAIPTFEPRSQAEADAARERNIASMERTMEINRESAGLRDAMSKQGNMFTGPGGMTVIEDKTFTSPEATAARRAGYSVDAPTASERAVQMQMREHALDRSSREREGGLNRAAQYADREAARDLASTDRRFQAELASADRAQTRALTLRGQDLQDARAHATALATLKQQDRQYALDAAKFGQQQAENNFNQRMKAEEDTRSHISTLIPNGPDGKPDTATAAQYTVALTSMVGSRISALERELQTNPNNKAAQTELSTLQTKGLAALDHSDRARFVAGMQARALSKEYSGMGPTSGTAVDSNAPVTSLSLKKGWLPIFDKYEAPDGTVIPKRAIDNSGNWFFDAPSSRFNGLKRQEQK